MVSYNFVLSLLSSTFFSVFTDLSVSKRGGALSFTIPTQVRTGRVGRAGVYYAFVFNKDMNESKWKTWLKSQGEVRGETNFQMWLSSINALAQKKKIRKDVFSEIRIPQGSGEGGGGKAHQIIWKLQGTHSTEEDMKTKKKSWASSSQKKAPSAYTGKR